MIILIKSQNYLQNKLCSILKNKFKPITEILVQIQNFVKKNQNIPILLGQ